MYDLQIHFTVDKPKRDTHIYIYTHIYTILKRQAVETKQLVSLTASTRLKIMTTWPMYKIVPKPWKFGEFSTPLGWFKEKTGFQRSSVTPQSELV